MREIPEDESVVDQLAFDRLDGAADTRVGRGQEADERDEEQARVDLLRPVRLDERPELPVEAALADLGVDLGAQLAPAVDGPLEPLLLDRPHGTVERDPRHHLRMHEEAPDAPDLPDS